MDLAWYGEIAEQQTTLYAIVDAARLAHGAGATISTICSCRAERATARRARAARMN